MIHIHVKSKAKAEYKNELDSSHVIISIRTPRLEQAVPMCNEHTKGVLFLAFDDLDGEPGQAWTEVYGQADLFTREHAEKIVAFLKQHEYPATVLVHCEAGVSRSAGVAAALAYFFNGDDSEYFTSPFMYSRTYYPNRLVRRVLVEVLMEQADRSAYGFVEEKVS